MKVKPTQNRAIEHVLISESDAGYLDEEHKPPKKAARLFVSEDEDVEWLDVPYLTAMSNANLNKPPTVAEWQGFENLNPNEDIEEIEQLVLNGKMLHGGCLDSSIQVLKTYSTFDLESTLAIAYQRYCFLYPINSVAYQKHKIRFRVLLVVLIF